MEFETKPKIEMFVILFRCRLKIILMEWESESFLLNGQLFY